MEGRKSQTRRILSHDPLYHPAVAPSGEVFDEGVRVSGARFGMVGGRLWVRETWAATLKGCDYDWRGQLPEGAADCLFYKADGDDLLPPEFALPDGKGRIRWRPSIHMPRWVSRIDLEVTGLRVERLQDISEEDALAEGVAVDRGNAYHVAGFEGEMAHATARGCMETLWGTINGAGSWECNPWVWVVEFRKLTTRD